MNSSAKKTSPGRGSFLFLIKSVLYAIAAVLLLTVSLFPASSLSQWLTSRFGLFQIFSFTSALRIVCLIFAITYLLLLFFRRKKTALPYRVPGAVLARASNGAL
jgi:hypothetical protein